MHGLISCLGRNALVTTLAILGFAVFFTSCQKGETPAPDVDQELVTGIEEKFEETGYMDASDLETEQFWDRIGAPAGAIEDKVKWLEDQRNEEYLKKTGEAFPANAFEPTKKELFEDMNNTKGAKASVDLTWACGPVWHQGSWHTNSSNGTENWYFKNSCQSHATAALQNAYTKRYVNSGFSTRSPYYLIRRHRDRWHFAAWWTLSYNMNICRWDGSLPINYSSNDWLDVKHMQDLVYSVGSACSPSNKKFPTWTTMYGWIIGNRYSRVQGTFGNRVKHMVRDYSHPVVITIWLDNSSGGINLVNRSGKKVWDNQPINYGKGLHVVTVVGYDDNTKLFKIKNSWGSGWGNSGYFYATKGRLNSFLYDAATYAF